MGHYPFNAASLSQAYARTNADGLNPRFLLSDVLRRTLLTYADKIERVAFPDGSYHSAFGGLSSRWTTTAIARIDRVAGAGAVADRYKALLDLWSRGRALPEGVYRAFGLEPLDGFDDAPLSPMDVAPAEAPLPPTQPSELPAGTAPAPDPESTVRGLLDALDGWARGEALDQHATNELRGYVYDAVRAGLDWDAARLLPSQLSGRSSGSFTRASINFEGQASAPRSAEVSVTLPLDGRDGPDPDRPRPPGARPLRGPRRMDVPARGRPSPPGGAFRDGSVGGGGAEVQDTRWRSLRAHRRRRRSAHAGRATPWPPGFHAEFARGTPRRVVPPVAGGRGTPEWQRLVDPFAKNREKLRDAVEAHALCAKGGSSATKWFDAVQFAPILRRRDATPRSSLPVDGAQALPGRLRVIGIVLEAYDQRVKPAVKAECAWWSAWSQRVEQALGDAAFADVRNAMNQTRRMLDGRGVSYLDSARADRLRSLSHGLNAADVDRVRGLARDISAADADSLGPLLRLIGYANTLRTTADRVGTYLELADAFCVTADAYLDHQVTTLGGGPTAETIHGKIGETLTALVDVLHPPSSTDP